MLTAAYKRYALAMMTTVYTVNLFDRGIMLLLLQPIKEDLKLSDTQLGFVTGIAFSVFYAVLGIPIARWADRGNRVTIASIAIGLWGLTSMVCLLVTNYFHLLLARIASAVGDAGVQPPIYSLLGDYFPEPAERTRAMYVWQLSSPLSAIVIFVAAGWFNERYGWRQAFFLVGLIGLVLAVITRAVLVEPRAHHAAAAPTAPRPPLRAVVSVLWQQRACRHLTFTMILIYMVGHGAVAWQSAFMIRQHGVGTAELGVWMGLIMGGGGVAALLLGRFIVNRWFIDNERDQMRLAGVCMACTAPVFVAFLWLPQKELALLMLLLQVVAATICSSPIYVLTQRLVPDDMRATVLTMQLFLASLLGMGFGPLIVGAMSDVFAPRWGGDSLRYAMMIMSLMWLWAGYHLYRVSTTIREDLRNALAHAFG